MSNPNLPQLSDIFELHSEHVDSPSFKFLISFLKFHFGRGAAIAIYGNCDIVIYPSLLYITSKHSDLIGDN